MVKTNSNSNSNGKSATTSPALPAAPARSQIVRVVTAYKQHANNTVMTIPKEVRDLAGIAAGDDLHVVGNKDGFTVKKIPHLG